MSQNSEQIVFECLASKPGVCVEETRLPDWLCVPDWAKQKKCFVFRAFMGEDGKLYASLHNKSKHDKSVPVKDYFGRNYGKTKRSGHGPSAGKEQWYHVFLRNKGL